MSHSNAVIVAAKRTAIGSFQGQFKDVEATRLGAAAIKGAMEYAGMAPDDIEEIIMGCVLPAGLGQAPARQAALYAGLPMAAGATTINKVCGSGMKAIMLATDLISAGSADVVLAGGMESMTNAPYMLPKARSGYRMGHGQILDHMFFDGLQNPYDQQMMGQFAESCVDKYQFTRAAQDAFSIASISRSMEAMDNGQFADEITPVTVSSRHGETVIDADEEPPRCNIEKIPNLRPAFRKDGTVTAANSSKISDGAAALVIMSASEAARRGQQPLASIIAHATHSQEPEWFTTAPIGAVNKLLDKTGWSLDDIDLFEINEAFATVTMAAIHDLALDPEKVNVNGGACSLGHPIGASGARIVVTLINALHQRGLKRGVAALCIGGGEATAVAIELP